MRYLNFYFCTPIWRNGSVVQLVRMPPGHGLFNVETGFESPNLKNTLLTTAKSSLRGINFYFCAPIWRNGSVVQLVRMPPCHGGGRGFESRPVRKKPWTSGLLFYVLLYLHNPKSTWWILLQGSSQNPKLRLEQHNRGLSRYTATKVPWKLVYVEEMPSKKEMLIRERKLKRGNKTYFLFLINSPQNIVHQFV